MHKQILGPVIIDIAGLSLTEDDKRLLSSPWVGGIILFSRNYSDRAQLDNLVAEIRAVNAALLIAVDHEGGRVQRFRSGFTRIPPMQRLERAFLDDRELGLVHARDIGWLLASELIASGVDISFAPVLDVDRDFSSIIGDRSFSADPSIVTLLTDVFIDGMHEAGMAATGKHFPGHGGIREDSHLELPIDKRELTELLNRDLIPFKALLPKLDAVMPAHILFSAIDDQPVGFSSWWLQTYLRGELGYKGIIFSDDLTMEGAVFAGNYGERALAALSAGCDSILICNNREGTEEALTALDSHFDEAQRAEVQRSPLHLMSARDNLDWNDLKSSKRWQQTEALCQSLIG